MIKPINRNNVTDAVFSDMMDMIVSGAWKVDEKIPSENELAEQFQVSRNSVKQAIHRISALGLLEAKQGGGTYVRVLEISSYMNLMLPTVLLGASNVRKLFEFQKGIQIECAKLACGKRSDEQIAGLTACIERMQAHLQRNEPEAFLDADLAFHTLVAQMTRNELFIKATELTERLLFYSLTRIIYRYDSNQSVDFHMQIRDAIQAGDEQSASTLMEAHLTDVIQKLGTVVPSDEA